MWAELDLICDTFLLVGEFIFDFVLIPFVSEGFYRLNTVQKTTDGSAPGRSSSCRRRVQPQPAASYRRRRHSISVCVSERPHELGSIRAIKIHSEHVNCCRLKPR